MFLMIELTKFIKLKKIAEQKQEIQSVVPASPAASQSETSDEK